MLDCISVVEVRKVCINAKIVYEVYILHIVGYIQYCSEHVSTVSTFSSTASNGAADEASVVCSVEWYLQ